MSRQTTSIGWILLALLVAGCAELSDASILISPGAVELGFGQQQQFQANVTGATNTTVRWSVQEPGGGTIDAAGLYTAPSVEGTFHVLAISQADSSRGASATVRVRHLPPEISVVIDPPSASVETGGSLSFAASVLGTADIRVEWSVQEGDEGGTIDATGRYLAPSEPGTYHVVATSVADPSRSATATVAVLSDASIELSIDPVEVTLAPNAFAVFSATLTGTSDTALLWSVQEGAEGGSVDATGRYQAPATDGVYHVVVSRQADPAKSATATVTVVTPEPVAVSVAPATVTLVAGRTQQFTASVVNADDTSVTWTVKQGAAGGSVSATGLYTAPAAAGTYQVVASSKADPSKSGSATVTVVPEVAITVSPVTASLSVGKTQRFVATVTGTTNTAVTWKVLEAGGGSVDASGLYTAPQAPGDYRVVATSSADPSKTATATVTVTPAVKVTINPPEVRVAPGGQAQFSASVSNAANTDVTWSVQQGSAGGQVSSAGLYTAPSVPGTFNVVATSKADPSKSASATVTVALPVEVAIAPETIAVQVGGTVQFTVSVTNSANTGVTWSVQQGASGGTISASGLYTAPSSTGLFKVVATSVADPTRKATASVTVTAAQPPISVVVSPTNSTVWMGRSASFTAMVTGTQNQKVTWAVQQGAAGGSIDSTGRYTAPLSPGVFQIVATSQVDTSRFGVATVTVPSISVSLAPASANLAIGESLAFVASVIGFDDDRVTWEVQEGAAGGTVVEGIYTAPAIAGTYHVIATSVADATTQAVAEVVVRPVVTVEPASLVLGAGETANFAALLDGAAGCPIAWTVQEGASGGSVDTSGAYMAPLQPGTYHVVATCADQPLSFGTAVVTVSAVSVIVSPAAVSVPAGRAVSFSAQVEGALDHRVDWRITEGAIGGAIDANGVYTAPATPGTYHVVAASRVDPSAEGTATVTVTAALAASDKLAAHYAADALLGYGVPVPADGTAIDLWRDLSGNGHDLKQTSAARQPKLQAAAVNGLPAVRFDGEAPPANDALTSAIFAAPLPQPTTIFIVYKVPQAATNVTIFDAPAAAPRNRIQVTPNPAGSIQPIAGSFSAPTTAIAYDVFHYAMVQFATPESTVRVDGAAKTRTNTNVNPGTLGLGGVQLGWRSELGDPGGASTIAEVLVYGARLDAAQIAEVEAYLKARYGI